MAPNQKPTLSKKKKKGGSPPPPPPPPPPSPPAPQLSPNNPKKKTGVGARQAVHPGVCTNVRMTCIDAEGIEGVGCVCVCVCVCVCGGGEISVTSNG